MAVDFPSEEQAAVFGRFPEEISTEDMERFCWLDDADLSAVDRSRGTHHRPGLAVQLITVQVVGRSPDGSTGRPMVGGGVLGRAAGPCGCFRSQAVRASGTVRL